MGGADMSSQVGGIVTSMSGMVQAIAGLSERDRLNSNRPKLGTYAGETANDLYYNKAANATEMPGQRQFEDKIGQAGAEGTYDVGRGAISSLNYTDNANKIVDKKMQAIQDLAGMFAEYKQKRLDALAGWNEKKIELEQQRFKVNTYDPWMMDYGEAIGNAQNGLNTTMSGIATWSGGSGGSTQTADLMGGTKSQGSSSQITSPKLSTQGLNTSGQDSLTNTLQGYRGQIKQ
jgi:hypothetical protein